MHEDLDWYLEAVSLSSSPLYIHEDGAVVFYRFARKLVFYVRIAATEDCQHEYKYFFVSAQIINRLRNAAFVYAKLQTINLP